VPERGGDRGRGIGPAARIGSEGVDVQAVNVNSSAGFQVTSVTVSR
jgi:hypothetical protein